MAMAEREQASALSTPTKKYQRYRNVHHAEPVAAPAPEKKEAFEAQVSRSMSRYRRPKRRDPVLSPPMPPAAFPPTQHQLSPSRHGEQNERPPNTASPSPQKQQLAANHDMVAGNRSPARRRETEEERFQRKAQELRDEEERLRRARKELEAEELRRKKAELEAVQLAEAEKERLLAEQKRKDLERLQAELEAAAPVRVLSPMKEKFSLFSRKRAQSKASGPTSPEIRNTSSTFSFGKSNQSPPQATSSKSTKSPPRAIEQGGGGIVPRIDAPQSASNAGERRVLIRCLQSSINLPITPETTPMDLVHSAANIMSQNISPSSAVLLESYTPLGLERRIRRYEHIRDIMNSWDRDTQNALILQNSDSPKHDIDLEVSSVPRTAPKDVTVFMYHSQKPGKWNKRYITLLSSGQIFMAKQAGLKPSDKDAHSLCHLSDFDIYSPTPQQLRKILRPPKKHCYAIKSQQRTAMFLNTENFVHFFSTDMEEVAEIWYQAVQKWRSWYLVTKLGEGKKAPASKKIDLIKKSSANGEPGHKVQVSVDETPYTIGTFKPLLDLNRFETTKKTEKEYDSDEENRPLQIPFHLRNGVSPPKKERSRYPPPVAYDLPPGTGDEEFATSGLLGRTYSQRQKAQKEREANGKQEFRLNHEFAPSHHRTNSVKSTRTVRRPESSSGLQRTATTKEPPKPLLDFAPTFKEAPQWDKSKHGRGVAAPSGTMLVEAATTPDNPLADPVGTVFRREPTVKRPVTAIAGGRGAFSKGGLISGT